MVLNLGSVVVFSLVVCYHDFWVSLYVIRVWCYVITLGLGVNVSDIIQ